MGRPVTSRAGVAVVGGILVVSIIALTLLERRSALREREIVEYARSRRADPVGAVVGAVGARRFVLLGDVAGAPAPKRFAADVIEALARGPGLDVVALEIGADMQPWLDRYFEGERENGALLLSQPRAVRQADGTAYEVLAIYSRVFQLNRELGADRRIRVLAIDAPGWAPDRTTSTVRLMPQFATRDEHMLAVIEERVLERNERSRVLVFVDGLRVLRAGLRLETGGTASAELPFLATRLRDRTGSVLSVLVDAPLGPITPASVADYRPGWLSGIVRRAGTGTFAFALTAEFPVRTSDLGIATPPGLQATITPGGRLSDVADVYVRLH